uniref:Uncharacterized protein n=1 Tax=Panagrolaimus sp. PS1159 TaxID=55785 RepID=A0AC35F5U4_9BILA
MSTKDDKYSFIEQNFTTSENQYYDLNLNQNKKCSVLIPVQSQNSKLKNNKYYVSENYEEKEKSESWNKSSEISTLNEENNDSKKRWKNKNTLNAMNKSTISLHISAYENSIASDLFDGENIERLKKDKLGSINTFKQSFTGVFKSQNPFEFPRQQSGDQKNKPEVMQFKKSQRLLGSQRPTLFQQIGNNDEQFVEPQSASDAGTSITSLTRSDSTLSYYANYRRDSLIGKSTYTLVSPRQGADHKSYISSMASDSVQSVRQDAERDSLMTSNSEQSLFQQNTKSTTPSSQHVKLITKRLAGGIDGCEVTIALQNENGNPLIIRAVCPKFEPRRIWVNGKPFDYIDSESDNPIYDSSIEYNPHEQMEDIDEDDEEDGTIADYDDEEEESSVDYDENIMTSNNSN